MRRALTDGQEMLLVEEYRKGKGQSVLAREFGIGGATVWNILKRRGVVQRKQVPKADPKEIRRLYNEGLSMNAVADRLGINYTTVHKFLSRDGGHVRGKANRIYSHNRRFFSVLTPDSCYWAGFLAADGNIQEKTRAFVTITLSEKDHGHLEKFRVSTCATNPVLRAKQGERFYRRLTISCSQWVDDLAKNFFITPRKCRTLKPPKHLPDGLAWHFIRGYFDGDGHSPLNGAALQFTSGSRVLIEWIHCMGDSYHKIYPHNGSWGLYICGPVMRSMVKKMYAGSTPFTRLGRKYERLEKHL